MTLRASDKGKRGPLPGRKVRGSSTGRPVMAALDLLGRRWTLRVLWELHGEEGITFRALQERCDGVSPTSLNLRLAELREAGIVEHLEAAGYRFTAMGRALFESLRPLAAWSERWARELKMSTRS
ncbi:MAG TPA: helix-turn-helix domain-containing protein [Polyangiaceae bacterium]|nr:helix-turn-helix domain-containing protein [Polyangiaceae bacterium]